jgi:hypothetical protein
MNKITTLASVALMTSISSVAFSANPPSVPANYDNGPQSPLVASTDLSDAERAAYGLYEGIMQIAEAKIHATSCTSAASTSTISVFSDGSLGDTSQNFADVISFGGTLSLVADLQDKVDFRGQKINVDQVGPGALAGTAVADYDGHVKYNVPNNMMYGSAKVDVRGINGFMDRYQSKVIKDFNRGSTNPFDPEYYNIYDWGLQSLHKLKFPVNKYWQRSKAHRDNGTPARTVFVKDRLVGSSKCRIVIDTTGFNNEDFFQQTGTLVIEKVKPSTPVPAFSEFPFNP